MVADNRLFTLIGVAAMGYLLYLLAPILTPFIAAGLLAYMADPLVDRLERWRLRRSLAVVVVGLLMVLVIGALAGLVIPLAKAQVGAFATKFPVYVDWLESKVLPHLRDTLGLELPEGELGLAPLLAEYGSKLGAWGTSALGMLGRSSGALVVGLANLLLIPVLTFYLLRDWDLLIARIGELVPLRYEHIVFSLARDSDQVLAGFLRGQIMVMTALAVIYTTGLLILGLDYALAIGVVAGFVSFVPYLGLVTGIVLAGLSALVQFQEVWPVVGVVVVFTAGQLIEGTFLTPKLVGDRIGLHPVLVIFAVMAGGTLFGFFGVLLALPAAAVVSVIVRFMYQHYTEDKSIETALEAAVEAPQTALDLENANEGDVAP